MSWIAIEGPDGVGKSTQSKLIGSLLKSRGITTEVFYQPCHYRDDIKNPQTHWIARRLLTAADHVQQVRKILPYLRSRSVFYISDRWHPLSDVVYAASMGPGELDLSKRILKAVEPSIALWPKPEIVILLDDKDSILEDRLKKKWKRENSPPDVFEADKSTRDSVRSHYRRVTAMHPHDTFRKFHTLIETILCAGLDSRKVHEKVVTLLENKELTQ